MTFTADTPFGIWSSPIDATIISESGSSIEDLLVDPIEHSLYVIEGRPLEGGRNAIVSVAHEKDVFDRTWNARSRVHEYGGTPAIAHGGKVYFSNIADSRVYEVDVKHGNTPNPVTPDNPDYRYGDFDVHPINTKWVVSILEDHTVDTATGIKSSLVVINIELGQIHIVASGADFYSSPRFSPDGRFIVWKEWNFPYMPFQACNLMLASVTFGSSDSFPSLNLVTLAFGNNERVAAEPNWTSNNQLIFISDKHGFLNPWILRNVNRLSETPASPLSPTLIEAEFGETAFFFGLSSFATYDSRHVVFSALKNGRAQLYFANLDTGSFTLLNSPYVLIQHMRNIDDGKVVFVGKLSDENPIIVSLAVDEALQPHFTAVRGNKDLLYSREFISMPRTLSLPVEPEGRLVHVIVYLPKNPKYAGGLEGELPPAIFNLHGGPNAMLDQALDWSKQFYTSRGWAWIDVNYNGSTGYGRAYMDALQGGWGYVDVRDSISALAELAKLNIIDTKRAAIRGRSGGGFTTLQTLSFPDSQFRAGTAWFPASDLVALHVNCHKFQAQYIPGLVGAKLEEDKSLWLERSPFYQAAKIKAPTLIMQGSIDRIVPPTQTQAMAKTIKENGGSIEYIEFEGEGHGWRKAENIRRSVEEELAFYVRTFNIQ